MDDNSFDPDTLEPPVPAGLSECSDAFGPVMEFFGLDPLVLIAAADGTPDAPERPTDDEQCREWMEHLSEAASRDLLHRFLTDAPNTVRADAHATIRREGEPHIWPTISLGRSLQALLDRTEQIRADHEAQEEKKRAATAKRAAAKQERQRQERMKKMASDPQAWLREASRLVDERGTANYLAAAETLADLREAIGGKEGEKITRKHAAHLVRKHPTLTRLKGSLRKSGLLE
jgi:hypothetical protein